MSERIELGVWTPDGDVMAVRDYLTGGAPWCPDLQDSALLVQAGGREWLGALWNLGAFAGLHAQVSALEPALRQRRPALLRSAVEDQAIVPYLLWDPDGESVHVTLFFITDETLNGLYPPDPRLDDYVVAHRGTLVSGLPDDLRAEAFEGLSLAYEATCTALSREAALGATLLERCA